MNRKRIIISIVLLAMAVPALLSAQVKIGYISSERIRTEYEEFKEAEAQLQLEFRKVQFEYSGKLQNLDSLKQSYESQRLMSSPEWRREKEQEIQNMELAIQNFQAEKVGPEGELYRRQAQMEYELLAKVKAAVDNVAISKGYDFIFDGSVSLLYGKPTHDLTDDVLYELGKVEPGQ
ncbi:MAG: OmpH family outer membrane protein [Candidatus Marinimicrobia bacterium]|nr:OmpH family outer membrane protein [Candidatus Neomarinimicrobiota bacterium]